MQKKQRKSPKTLDLSLLLWYDICMEKDMRNQDEIIEKLLISIDKLTLKLEASEEKNALLEEQVRLLTQKRFGTSSEKTNPDQLSFFEEAKEESCPEPTIETITYKRRKKTGKRQEQLDGLPIEEIHYELSDEEKVCAECNNELHDMGSDIRKEIKLIPAQAIVVHHVQHKYACRCCEKENITTTIKKAKAPESPIPKSVASPSLVSFIMSQKYSESMPLHRQERYLASLGLTIQRQTMANWMIYTSEHWLAKLYLRLKEVLVTCEILHADETTLQVLREDGRKASQKSYLWLYCSGATYEPIVLFDYQPSRSGECPQEFLKNFEGYIHCDAYAGYNKVDNVELVGCLAHARRKYKEAVDAGKKGSKNNSIASEGLRYINVLFAIEKKIANFKPEDRQRIRATRSKKVLALYLAWLETTKEKVLPKSKLGIAVNYSLNNWENLTRYIEDERLEISNNRAERAIKPVVIGRKNWIFSASAKGAKASAIIYSIVETAKANGLIPHDYLNYLLEEMPNMEMTQENIDNLLPWSESIPESCKIKK